MAALFSLSNIVHSVGILIALTACSFEIATASSVLKSTEWRRVPE